MIIGEYRIEVKIISLRMQEIGLMINYMFMVTVVTIKRYP